jgi:hypothetical protein
MRVALDQALHYEVASFYSMTFVEQIACHRLRA